LLSNVAKILVDMQMPVSFALLGYKSRVLSHLYGVEDKKAFTTELVQLKCPVLILMFFLKKLCD
jgi:hypothetical protein